MSLSIVPMTVQDAREYVRQHHRHHPPPVSGLYAVSCAAEGVGIVGVAIVGRPVARGLNDGWTAEVTRVATDATTLDALTTAREPGLTLRELRERLVPQGVKPGSLATLLSTWAKAGRLRTEGVPCSRALRYFVAEATGTEGGRT